MTAHQANIRDDGSLHKYRTEIPNTVVRGIKSRGISIYAKWLYVYLKSVTGENGVCFRSTTTLAAEAGMSRGQVSAAKKALVTHGLIVVTHGTNPRRDTDHIRIKDLWPQNMQEFGVHATNTEAETVNGTTQGDAPPSVHDMNAECSPYELGVHGMNSVFTIRTKEDPIKKEPSKKEENSLPSGEPAPTVQSAQPVQGTKKKGPLTRSRFLPETFTVTPTHRAWAAEACPDVDVDAETAIMRDHEFKDPHSDWDKAWRNWIRRASTILRHGRHAPMATDDLTAWAQQMEKTDATE